MAQENYEHAWKAYQEAVEDLREPPVGAAVNRGTEEMNAERIARAGDAILVRSTEVRSALVDATLSQELEQRELAALKLVAVAACDLAVAAEMLDSEKPASSRGGERAANLATVAIRDLRDILDAPLAGGRGTARGSERAARSPEPKAARAELEKTIASFLIRVPKSSAELGQTAVTGMASLALEPLHAAATVVVDEILRYLPDNVSVITRRAAALVVEAVRKLRAAMGADVEKTAEDAVRGWWTEIQNNRDSVTSLLDRLYETKRIAEETTGRLAAAPPELAAAVYNAASDALEGLLTSQERNAKTLKTVMRVMSYVKVPLMGLAPWGPITVYATYSSILGYAVYSGGDYVDWYWTENRKWLNRVKGLRTVMREAFPAGATAGAIGGVHALPDRERPARS